MDDYSVRWFEEDGKLLTKLMIFTGLNPIIEATFNVPFYWLLRWIDRNLNRLLNNTLTAMPTVDAYIELHGGPDF